MAFVVNGENETFCIVVQFVVVVAVIVVTVVAVAAARYC